MKTLYKWKVKDIILKDEVIEEFEYQALQKIINNILEGKFKVNLEKEEINVYV